MIYFDKDLFKQFKNVLNYLVFKILKKRIQKQTQVLTDGRDIEFELIYLNIDML